MTVRRWSGARFASVVDVGMAAVMAAAAVATAWATYQGSQWDGGAAAARSQSAILRSDAGRAASDAVTQTVVDAQMWMQWEQDTLAGDEAHAEVARTRFSPALEAAHQAWLGNMPVDEGGNPQFVPTGSPLLLEVYAPPAQAKGDQLAGHAEDLLGVADRASDLSSRYVMQAVLLAMVLFFGSAAAKFTEVRLQAALAVLAVAMLAGSAVRLATLPVM